MALPYSRTLNYTYDSLNRPLTKTITGGTADVSERYTYRNGTGTGKTTHLVSKITYSDDSYLQYGHDALNNIIAVFDEAGKSVTYEYDGLGQLIRENNPYSNKTYMYNYDTAGNINAVRTYDYTTGEISGTPDGIATYTYSDSTWKDKLTNYNGTAITYDSIGNPLNYRNGTLTWNGRQLASYTNSSGSTTSYNYDVNGVRIGKSGAKNVSYVVSGTQILSETNGTTTTYYIYDDKGLPIGLVYNGTTYTYRKNVQGDIIAILNSAGTEVVNYTYNAWGRIINMSGSAVATIGQANPFRYRGYYYDTETGYYYLNSRYYDPTTGRFLNADGFVSTGQGVLGYNMFAYCGNNPVMRVDPNGLWWDYICSNYQTGLDALGRMGKKVTTTCAGFVAQANAVVNIRSTATKIAVASAISLIGGQASISDIITDIGNYDFFNSDESKADECSVFSSYKGTPILKNNIIDISSFSIFNTIVYSPGSNSTTDTIRHEWGHTVQQSIIGTPKYLTRIAFPSLIGCILDVDNYYSQPWERSADFFGQPIRPEGYTPFSDIIGSLYFIFP